MMSGRGSLCEKVEIMIRVERVAGFLKRISVTCDICRLTFPDEKIEAGGGLKKMGWKQDKDKHYCEGCKDENNRH